MGQERINIDTLILDYGRVISLDQHPGHFREMSRFAKTDESVLKEQYFKHRLDYDKGVITAESYWALVLESCSVPFNQRLLRRLIALDIASWTNINQNMIQFIKDVKGSGKRLVLLSNMPFEIKEYVITEFSWIKDFDQLVFSCDLKMLKPDTKIFDYVINNYELNTEKTLFIDDSERNVLAAQERGLNTILFDDIDDFYKQLLEYDGIEDLCEL